MVLVEVHKQIKLALVVLVLLVKVLQVLQVDNLVVTMVVEVVVQVQQVLLHLALVVVVQEELFDRDARVLRRRLGHLPPADLEPILRQRRHDAATPAANAARVAKLAAPHLQRRPPCHVFSPPRRHHIKHILLVLFSVSP